MGCSNFAYIVIYVGMSGTIGESANSMRAVQTVIPVSEFKKYLPGLNRRKPKHVPLKLNQNTLTL